MKSILSGLILHQYLSMRCLIAKTIGTVCSYAGGLAVGMSQVEWSEEEEEKEEETPEVSASPIR